ncbi:MAG: hypothetical protein KAT28_01850 [Candidatus Aenigmarchaeota archaeon]|nr:hypothetical protein [Candidatus Aenigmarchaeota archaeon]
MKKVTLNQFLITLLILSLFCISWYYISISYPKILIDERQGAKVTLYCSSENWMHSGNMVCCEYKLNSEDENNFYNFTLEWNIFSSEGASPELKNLTPYFKSEKRICFVPAVFGMSEPERYIIYFKILANDKKTTKIYQLFLRSLILETYTLNSERELIWNLIMVFLISLTLIISVFSWRHSIFKEEEKQEDLIKSLQSELKIVNRHYEWYNKHIPNKRLPEHGIYRINPSFYIKNLKPKINNIPTEDLKWNLSLLVDKIDLINTYTRMNLNNKNIGYNKIELTLIDLKKYIGKLDKNCKSI